MMSDFQHTDDDKGLCKFYSFPVFRPRLRRVYPSPYARVVNNDTVSSQNIVKRLDREKDGVGLAEQMNISGGSQGSSLGHSSPTVSSQNFVKRLDREMDGSGGSQGTSLGRSSSTDPGPNTMFVGGLLWQTTAEKLRDYFGSYGLVKDVRIIKDPVTQRSRGFGFITFGDPSSVEKVISVPNHILDGKKIDTKHAVRNNKGRTNRTKKIFVGGVSQDTSAEEVKGYFSQFGKVEEAVMLMDNQTKRHRGFGFVTFECEDVVENVCEIHFHTIKNKKVECKKAQPKEAVQSASLLSKGLLVTESLASPIDQALLYLLHQILKQSQH